MLLRDFSASVSVALRDQDTGLRCIRQVLCHHVTSAAVKGLSEEVMFNRIDE